MFCTWGYYTHSNRRSTTLHRDERRSAVTTTSVTDRKKEEKRDYEKMLYLYLRTQRARAALISFRFDLKLLKRTRREEGFFSVVV